MNGGEPDKDLSSRRRAQRGWYFYDWATSAFSTTVVTVFLGPYLTAITENAADANGLVYPLRIPVLAGSYFPYVLSGRLLPRGRRGLAILPARGFYRARARR